MKKIQSTVRTLLKYKKVRTTVTEENRVENLDNRTNDPNISNKELSAFLPEFSGSEKCSNVSTWLDRIEKIKEVCSVTEDII